MGGPSSSSIKVEIIDFFNSISLKLINLPLLDKKFDWFQFNNGAASRLDHILVSNGWWNNWGEMSQLALPINVYDHSYIILKYAN